MTFLRSWLLAVFAAAAALSVLYSLIPKGKFLVIAKYTGGLVLVLVLLRPLLRLDSDELLRSLSQWPQEIQASTAAMQAENEDTLSALIADKTAAYIQKKAAQLGVDCHAEVICEMREGTPFPVRVYLDVPRSGALEALIAADLDIPAAQQFWREEHQ